MNVIFARRHARKPGRTRETHGFRDEVSGENIEQSIGKARPNQSHLVHRGNRDQHHAEIVEVEKRTEHGIEVPKHFVG